MVLPVPEVLNLLLKMEYEQDNTESQFNLAPRPSSTSVQALEKIKRRTASIRSFSSSVLSESLQNSVLQNNQPDVNPRFSVRRSNSTKNRLSMPLEKLIEMGKKDEGSNAIESIVEQDETRSIGPSFTSVLNQSSTIISGASGNLVSEPQDSDSSEPKISISRLYLQLESQVKKTSYFGPLSISSLQMLFVEKFQYNPGPYKFPELYIKDPIIDVYYELEDLSEVREGSVLQLNVSVSSNALKKNMDSNFSTMVMEIRDLRRLMTQNNEASKKQSNRMSMAMPPISRFPDLVKKAVKAEAEKEAAASHQVDLAPIRDELATLRKDLSIVRQTTFDFQKESLNTIKKIQDISIAYHDQLSNDQHSIHRLLVSGKERMDQTSIDLANMLDEIQKNVEDFRSDLVQRRCQPSQLRIKHTVSLMEKVNQTLLSESEFISEVKPTWKKTWEFMLQDIVKEQQALKEHEAIIDDMRADHEHLSETLSQLKKFMELKRKSRQNRPSFEVVPVGEDDDARQNLLQEISCVDADSARRLRAFEEAMQSREWELQNQVNPFEEELSDFVSTSKLRKTGGTEELDKRRRQQDEDNLKAMLAPRPRPPASKSPRRAQS